MPSAAAAKLEKQPSTEGGDPIKQVITLVDKKVRNLEKRKGKLDIYKEESQQGKELNEDQRAAVEKYGEVVQTLEFARELHKQFTTIQNEHTKAVKKQIKKEQLEKQQNDILRFKISLVVQDVLNNMGNENAREDFLRGANGACKLSQVQLDCLDELYKLLYPSRDSLESGQSLEMEFASAAEHMYWLVEGKKKEVLGSTYRDIKDTILKIYECGYFSVPSSAPCQVVNHVEEDDDEKEAHQVGKEDTKLERKEEERHSSGGSSIGEDLEEPVTNSSGQLPQSQRVVIPGPPDTVRSAHLQAQSDLPQAVVSQHDSSLFSAEAPYGNQVMNAAKGNFTFLHESQLLEAHVDPTVVAAHLLPRAGTPGTTGLPTQVGSPSTAAAIAPTSIPSQTFTNQSFSSLPIHGMPHSRIDPTPNPPPPIPLPPCSNSSPPFSSLTPSAPSPFPTSASPFASLPDSTSPKLEYTGYTPPGFGTYTTHHSTTTSATSGASSFVNGPGPGSGEHSWKKPERDVQEGWDAGDRNIGGKWADDWKGKKEETNQNWNVGHWDGGDATRPDRKETEGSLKPSSTSWADEPDEVLGASPSYRKFPDEEFEGRNGFGNRTRGRGGGSNSGRGRGSVNGFSRGGAKSMHERSGDGMYGGRGGGRDGFSSGGSYGGSGGMRRGGTFRNAGTRGGGMRSPMRPNNPRPRAQHE